MSQYGRFNEIEKDKIFKAYKRPKDSMNMSKDQLIDSTKKFFELYATKGFDRKNEKWKQQDSLRYNDVKFSMLGTTDFTEEDRKKALTDSLIAATDYAYDLWIHDPEKYVTDKIQLAIATYTDIWTEIVHEFEGKPFAKEITNWGVE